jgi:hypothetical protein
MRMENLLLAAGARFHYGSSRLASLAHSNFLSDPLHAANTVARMSVSEIRD